MRRRFCNKSALGLGRVKTPTRNLRVEIPSRFRQLENQKYLRPLLGEDDRENNSAHSWLVHVFTQPGSIATVGRCPCHFRFSPDSDQRTDIAECLQRAKGGHTDGPSGSALSDNTDHRIATRLTDFPMAISCDQFIHSADDSHGQRFRAAAHVYLVHRKPAHFNAGSGGDDVGHNELTAIIFSQLLEARGYMYRIADCCQDEAIPVAKLAQDHVAGVEPDADCNWLRQLVSQCSIHVRETAMNKLRRNQRLGASLTRPGLYAEDRHHAIADELVGHAAGIDYRSEERRVG